MPSRKIRLPQSTSRPTDDITRHERGSSRDNEAHQDLLLPHPAWPDGITYLTHPVSSSHLTTPQSKWLHRKPNIQTVGQLNDQIDVLVGRDALPVVRLPLTRKAIDGLVEVKKITVEKHPANGQFGLFAARDLSPASEQAQHDLLANVGGYTSDIKANAIPHDTEAMLFSPEVDTNDTHEHGTLTEFGSWDKSDYDLNLHRDGEVELAVDAAQMGNEARFCNDYRGVPAQGPLSQHVKMQHDRNSKRSVKGWQAEGLESRNSYMRNYTIEMAVPNAEFRDVWFEWHSGKQSRPSPAANTQCARLVDNHTDQFNKLQISAYNETAELGLESSPLPVSAKSATSKSPRQARHKASKSTGMRGVAIFVLPVGNSGKRKHGIRRGQEVLVSYGKGFWAHHKTDAT